MSPARPHPVPRPPLPGPRAEDWLARQLVAVAGGDPDAFATLYAALFPQLRSVAAQKLRDHGQAEDVAQEVMIELLTRAGSWSTSDHDRPRPRAERPRGPSVRVCEDEARMDEDQRVACQG